MKLDVDVKKWMRQTDVRQMVARDIHLTWRKLRLLSAGFLREVEDSLEGDERKAIFALERMAETGEVDRETFALRHRLAETAFKRGGGDWKAHLAWNALREGGISEIANLVTGNAKFLLGNRAPVVLREIIMPPLDVEIDSWKDDPDVVALARACYQGGYGAEFGLLHDALIDAGCDSEALLEHLRQEKHLKGCWAVDLILGKS